MRESFVKKITIPTASQLKDKEIREEGKGIIVIRAPVGATIRFNSLLSDPISLVDVESIYLPFERFYITSPASTVDIVILVLKENVYIDANSQYSVLAKIGAYMHSMLLASARRGNYLEVKELDPSAGPQTVEKPQYAGPFRIANIISFMILTDPTGWNAQITGIRYDTNEPINSTLDLSLVGQDATVHINAAAITFVPSEGAQPLKLIVEYLITPAWEV